MALLLQGQGTAALTGRLEVDLLAPAPVGAFVTVRAELLESRDRRLVLNADAEVEGETVGRAKGVFVRST
jgi:predicted thioesterase